MQPTNLSGQPNNQNNQLNNQNGQTANPFGMQSSQSGIQHSQFGSQAGQFGSQPGQLGLQPSQFNTQPAQFGSSIQPAQFNPPTSLPTPNIQLSFPTPSITLPNNVGIPINSTVGLPSPINLSHNISKPDINNLTDKENSIINANESKLVTSMKDNTVSLYNLKLKEIIESQVQELERNIKEFRKTAQDVFEQDMKIIQAKNRYLEIKETIKREESRLMELDEGLECLEKHLDGLPKGTTTEMGRCCEEFESICDKFYARIDSLKDEKGTIMDLINENYGYVDGIDAKLDMLELSYE